MKANRALFRLLIGAFAMVFMLGSSVSAVEAASTCIDAPVMAIPIKSDCASHGKPRGCVVSCVLVCGAIAPTDQKLVPPASSAAILGGAAEAPSVPYSSGPEPPPPRT
jgi:hypothetical protein